MSLSLLILNETKESDKMEVAGFGNRRSSSEEEFYFKNILLHVLREYDSKYKNFWDKVGKHLAPPEIYF